MGIFMFNSNTAKVKILAGESKKAPYLYASRPIPMLPNLKVQSIASPAGFLEKF